MSRVGKQPVMVPAGVTVKVNGQEVAVSGPKGSIASSFPSSTCITYDAAAKCVRVATLDDAKQSRANHGLTRAVIANMVKGVSQGFEKRLQIYGTGYNCTLKGRTLHLNIGFSGRNRGIGAQFELPLPPSVEVVIEKEAARGDSEPAQLVVRGFDKQMVGQFAAEIRALRKTEPYKGKGIRYHGEVIKKKQGKALTGSA